MHHHLVRADSAIRATHRTRKPAAHALRVDANGDPVIMTDVFFYRQNTLMNLTSVAPKWDIFAITIGFVLAIIVPLSAQAGEAGVDWASQPSPSEPWLSVTYGNGRFVAVGNNSGVMTSFNGATWTQQTSASVSRWFAVTYGNGVFVAVAANSPGNQVMSSTDGINWTSRTTPASAANTWRSVTYGNGRFVAVASSGSGNRVMTSTNGENWISRTSAADSSWYSVTYGNGVFVAVAASGTGNQVMSSPNGIDWTGRTSANDNVWTSVTYGEEAELFVAVAQGNVKKQVMTSPNGIDWTERTSAVNKQWRSVTHGTGLFVAVALDGSDDRVMTSPNGIDWTRRTSAADNSWYSVTYGNGVFVAVSASGQDRVMTSGNLPTPAAPTGLLATPGDEQVVITFSAGLDNGSPITNYQYSLDGGDFTALNPAVAASPISITGLENGQTYSIRLKAVNDVGSSAGASGAVTVAPAPPTPAPAPAATPVPIGPLWLLGIMAGLLSLVGIRRIRKS